MNPGIGFDGVSTLSCHIPCHGEAKAGWVTVDDACHAVRKRKRVEAGTSTRAPKNTKSFLRSRATRPRHGIRMSIGRKWSNVTAIRGSLRRKPPREDKQFAKVDPKRRVDVQDVDGRASASRPANKPRAIPLEVATPALPTWIEEHNGPTAYEISATQVAGFCEVAFMTRPCKVSRIVVAVVLLRDNMLDVKRIEGQVVFVQAAVLTTPASTRTDQFAEEDFHAGCPRRLKRSRALAWRIATK